MNPCPRRESCGELVGVADIVGMCEKDIGDFSMLLEKILETPDAARRIDEQIVLAAPEEVGMRSVRGTSIKTGIGKRLAHFLWKVGLRRASSALALY
jgi:hypothetical protein